MPTPPLSKKFIPTAAKAWRGELLGNWKYLKRLGRLRTSHGDDWVDKQRDYVVLRLCDLIDNVPQWGHVPRYIQQWRGKQKWPRS